MPFRFRLRLPGASLRDRAIACLGALAGIAATAMLSRWIAGTPGALLIVAPMGASAVLLFAVPASPLAQPWPAIGGNMLSVLVGVAAARIVPVPALAAGVAVAGAILVMSLTRSLHPPGGAAALLAATGGPAIGFGFAVVPVGLNAVLLTLAAIAFHRLTGHSYPHRAKPGGGTAHARRLDDADIDRALAELGEAVDIARGDLVQLAERASFHAAERRRRMGRDTDGKAG